MFEAALGAGVADLESLLALPDDDTAEDCCWPGCCGCCSGTGGDILSVCGGAVHGVFVKPMTHRSSQTAKSE